MMPLEGTPPILLPIATNTISAISAILLAVARKLKPQPQRHDGQFESVADFMNYRLRKVPRPAEYTELAGYKFELIGTDSRKIDQLLLPQVMK